MIKHIYRLQAYIVRMICVGVNKKKTDMRLPVKFLDEIDEHIKDGLYANRTEFVQEAIRDKLLKLGAKSQ